MLRSLPAVNRINMITQWEESDVVSYTTPDGLFTYPKQWRQLGDVEQFGMEPHEWELLDNINPGIGPVCALTNTYYEQQLPYSIGSLISKCRAVKQPIYVFADEEEFEIHSATRPLREEPYTFPVDGGYPVVYEALKKYYQSNGIRFPLTDTRNVFLQDNAYLFNQIQSRNSVSSAEELFQVLPEAPYLPLYGAMVRIFNRTDSKGADAIPSEEVDGLRKWLMRRINWPSSTARDVAELLNEKVEDADRDPYYVLGACNPNVANRALDASDNRIGGLFPCNVVVWQDEPERQIVYHVSIMRIARLVGLAPDDDEWADIVAETGELVDEAWSNLDAA